MSRVALLDVNLLVALFDPDHIHHDLVHDWFSDHEAQGWATCPITENGFLRILTNPAYGAADRSPASLISHLHRFCAGKHHHFWPNTVSLSDESLFDPALIRGHRQLTDIYLLGLAKQMKGCLATFDRTILIRAVKGAKPDLLQVIAPVDASRA